MARSGNPQGRETNEETQGVGEFRSGSIAGTALISGATFAGKPVHYAEVDGLAIFEGDIILGTVAEMQDGEGLESIGITGSQFRWPSATVAYEIDPAMPNQQRITDAIAHWQANTRIRFVQRTSQANYVRFQSGSGCSSSVGMRGGRQIITLGSGCSTGNAIHEIGHTVGLWHEQSRQDRDTFVRIVWANIDASMQHNFTQHISDGDDLGAYDYGSIMHYPADAFSRNGQATIVALRPIPSGVVMGQRNGLSAGDIAGVHAMYPARFTTKEIRKDPIADPTIKEIRKDPIRDTIKELSKDPIRDTIKEVGKDSALDTRVEGIRNPGQPVVIQPDAGGGAVSPFVVATPSRAANAGMQGMEEALSQVQELEAAMSALQQEQMLLQEAHEAALQALTATQHDQEQMQQAYDAAMQTLDAMQQGQGS